MYPNYDGSRSIYFIYPPQSVLRYVGEALRYCLRCGKPHFLTLLLSILCHTFTVEPLRLTALMLCKAQLFLHWRAPLLQEKDGFSPYRDGIQLSLNYRGLNGYNSIFAKKQVHRYIVCTFVSPFLVCGLYPHGCKKGCLYV